MLVEGEIVSLLTEADVDMIIDDYDDQFPLPFVLVVCGYAFILLIDKVIIDSHSSHIGHSHVHKAGSGEDLAVDSSEEAADQDTLDSPGADIKEALDSIKLRGKKSTSVAGPRPRQEELVSPSKGSGKHVHNEDCHQKKKSKKQIQKEMLEQSLQQHFKKTDKFSGAMKNLIDEHKREVKRVRIQKNDQLFKSYTPAMRKEGPNMFLVDSPESNSNRKFAAINSP